MASEKTDQENLRKGGEHRRDFGEQVKMCLIRVRRRNNNFGKGREDAVEGG